MTEQTTTVQTSVPKPPFPTLDSVQSRLNAGLAKAQDVTDRIMVYGRGNIDATLQGGRIWADGTRTIRDREIGRAHV